jgi:beta-glucuronidase
MINRIPRHRKRFVQSLDGIWDFAFLGMQSPERVDLSQIVYNDQMVVPGCFDATPGYAGKRGLAAYRTWVDVQEDMAYHLVFDSVHHWCQIFINGQPLKEHAGGFTRFTVDFAGPKTGRAELAVLVDNQFDENRSPLHQEYFDWYQYGGISRSVNLHQLGKQWIDNIQVVTQDLSPPTLNIRITYGAVQHLVEANLEIKWNERSLLTDAVHLKDTTGQLEYILELPGADLWSPEHPALHTLEVDLGEDDWRLRTGLRIIQVQGKEILINHQPVRLLGVNRHEFHPQFGHALPDGVILADIQQIKQLGCNFVRGSHYPQDERFLEICDEAGICVWSESTGWQHTSRELSNQQFLAAQLTNIDEMVAVASTHPSVILWGILNESDSNDERCRPAYETLLGRLRTLDPSRPVTFASYRPYNDLCFDLVDVVSVNCYPGWYIGDIEHIPNYIDDLVEHLDANGQHDKPLIISEIGAGGIPGWRDWNETRWSEQYQARLLEIVIQYMFRDRDRFCGLAIWQYCDIRSSESVQRILGRPRGFNNKGLVDEYRRPKQAFQVVKNLFQTLREIQQPTPEVQTGVLLLQLGWTLAAAESCTGGALGDCITDVPGSSAYFLGGMVTYANEAKTSLLNVQPETLSRAGAVSKETVLEMARGIRQALGADVGISISGIAGPDGGTPEKPVGTAWIGLSMPGLEKAQEVRFSGNRSTNKTSFVQAALKFLVESLLEFSESHGTP